MLSSLRNWSAVLSPTDRNKKWRRRSPVGEKTRVPIACLGAISYPMSVCSVVAPPPPARLSLSLSLPLSLSFPPPIPLPYPLPLSPGPHPQSPTPPDHTISRSQSDPIGSWCPHLFSVFLQWVTPLDHCGYHPHQGHSQRSPTLHGEPGEKGGKEEREKVGRKGLGEEGARKDLGITNSSD